jgi:superoxide reductase
MMTGIAELLQSADWKSEKHVPVIEVSSGAKKGEPITATVTVGKEVSHPNTTEHHICWVELAFLPNGEKFPYQLGRFEFSAHGASTQGVNSSTVYTHPHITASFKTEKPGTLFAVSYCNIHGFWQSQTDVAVS